MLLSLREHEYGGIDLYVFYVRFLCWIDLNKAYGTRLIEKFYMLVSANTDFCKQTLYLSDTNSLAMSTFRDILARAWGSDRSRGFRLAAWGAAGLVLVAWEAHSRGGLRFLGLGGGSSASSSSAVIDTTELERIRGTVNGRILGASRGAAEGDSVKE
jgi:hypothetical protein